MIAVLTGWSIAWQEWHLMPCASSGLTTMWKEGLSARQRALHAGFSQAKGEFICVLDDDGHAPQQWVRTRLNILAEKRAGGVGGPVNFRSGKGWIRVFQTVDAYYYLRVCQILNRLGMNSSILFGNFAFRRSIYHRVGGFRANGLSLTEDLVFARRLRGLGHRLVFDFDDVVEVSACRSLGELIERAKRVSFSGGISVLATLLGCWMITLPVLIIGALSWLPCLSWILAARYGSGVLFAACSVLKAGQPGAVCMALVYEPLAILIGFAALLKRLVSRHIEWGGVRYRV